jgi:hypothetical protein
MAQVLGCGLHSLQHKAPGILTISIGSPLGLSHDDFTSTLRVIVYNGVMNKLLIILVLLIDYLISGFVALPDNTPTRIEIDGHVFAVDLSGEAPVYEGIIGRFVENVYIAHNGLAGKYFTDNATITYANGDVKEYREVETIILQALDPYDPATKYTDGTYVYTSDDIHLRIFSRGVVFATCYDKNGQIGWGRKFIVMEEVINAR